MDVILSQSARIIGLLIIGFLLRQGQIIRPEDGHVILCLIITITLPAVIFVSLARADVELGSLMILALCGAAIPLILHWLVMWLARTVRLKRGVAGLIVVSTIDRSPILASFYSRSFFHSVGTTGVANWQLLIWGTR